MAASSHHHHNNPRDSNDQTHGQQLDQDRTNPGKDQLLQRSKIKRVVINSDCRVACHIVTGDNRKPRTTQQKRNRYSHGAENKSNLSMKEGEIGSSLTANIGGC